MNEKIRLQPSKLWNSDQSWFFESLWKIEKRVVRIHIRRNAYNQQSYEQVYLFDGDKWNLIVNLPISQSFEKIHYTHKELSSSQEQIFYDTEKILIETISTILFNHDRNN